MLRGGAERGFPPPPPCSCRWRGAGAGGFFAGGAVRVSSAAGAEGFAPRSPPSSLRPYLDTSPALLSDPRGTGGGQWALPLFVTAYDF